MNHENENKLNPWEDTSAFLPEGYKLEAAQGLDQYEEDLVGRVKGGIAQITGLEWEDFQPLPKSFIPVDPYSLDLGAIAASGKKKEVIEFLKEWLGWLTSNIEGSQYFHGKHVPYEDYYDEDSEYESYFDTWDDMPRRLQKFILSLKVRDWVAKLIPDLTAAAPAPGQVPAAETDNIKMGSEPQQVLVMHYIFKYLRVDATNVEKAKLIQFLTGRHHQNLRALLSNPLSTKDGNFRGNDLEVIRPFFLRLGLSEIVKMIENEQSSK